MSNDNFQIAHSSDHQGTLSAFELIEACSCGEQQDGILHAQARGC